MSQPVVLRQIDAVHRFQQTRARAVDLRALAHRAPGDKRASARSRPASDTGPWPGRPSAPGARSSWSSASSQPASLPSRSSGMRRLLTRPPANSTPLARIEYRQIAWCGGPAEIQHLQLQSRDSQRAAEPSTVRVGSTRRESRHQFGAEQLCSSSPGNARSGCASAPTDLDVRQQRDAALVERSVAEQELLYRVRDDRPAAPAWW